MEQVRNRVNIRLIADPAKLRKAVSKPSYREAKIINPDLVMVRAARQKNCPQQAHRGRLLHFGTIKIDNVSVFLRLSETQISRTMYAAFHRYRLLLLSN